MTRALLALGAALVAAACSSPYCGAPCEKQAPHATVSFINQYGTVFGYLEVQELTETQLAAERNSLEALLKVNPKDSAILMALKAKDDGDYPFDYNDNSAGGARFHASGKLRRPPANEEFNRKIPRLIGESENRELFERYRQVRRRLYLAPRQAELAAQAALDAPKPEPPPPDTLWTGSYRSGADSAVAAPERFGSLAACEEWGRARSEGLRQKAYAFEYACRRGAEEVRRKLW
jgi:hypothetical protein